MFQDRQEQKCSVLSLLQISYDTQSVWQWNLIKHGLKKKKQETVLMVQTLKPGQYKEDCPITTFPENKMDQ